MVRRNGDNLDITTVWIDDLLLFTSCNKCMANLKDSLKKTFDITDLGTPM